jgi:hypothetical protein
MAVIVVTPDPAGLLRGIKDQMTSGKIDTWSVDSDGDFTHTPPQWNKQAWLRPSVETDRIVLRILTPKGRNLSRAAYAVYHGRFIEMLLTHADDKFSNAWATAMPAHGDVTRA